MSPMSCKRQKSLVPQNPANEILILQKSLANGHPSAKVPSAYPDILQTTNGAKVPTYDRVSMVSALGTHPPERSCESPSQIPFDIFG